MPMFTKENIIILYMFGRVTFEIHTLEKTIVNRRVKVDNGFRGGGVNF